MNPLEHSIVLIGMMGAGKSTVGAVLERRTGIPCVDLDEIFSRDGEAGFRDLEAKILADLPAGLRAIVVTGGGIILRPENRRKLEQLGTIVWLDGAPEVLLARATENRNRPLLNNAPDRRGFFLKLLNERRPLYEQLADFRVDTTHLNQLETADRVLRETAALPEGS